MASFFCNYKSKFMFFGMICGVLWSIKQCPPRILEIQLCVEQWHNLKKRGTNNQQNTTQKLKMIIGIAVPGLHTGFPPGVKVCKGGVVGGGGAFLIRLEANLHIRQPEWCQCHVCCWSAPVKMEGRVYVLAGFSLKELSVFLFFQRQSEERIPSLLLNKRPKDL